MEINISEIRKAIARRSDEKIINQKQKDER